MNKDCEICFSSFAAKRKTAKYCSDKCKKRAQRGFLDVMSETKEMNKPLAAETPRGVKELEQKAPLEEGWVQRLNDKLRAKGLPLLTKEPEVYRFIPTGIAELDDLTASVDIENVGGFPRKRITQNSWLQGSWQDITY